MNVKGRYEGIQTVFEKAGKSACLFLSLLSIAEEYTGLPVDFIVAYRKCIDLGLIEKDFFCNDQEKILYEFTGAKWEKTVVKELPDTVSENIPSPVPGNMYTVEKWFNERTGFTHFKRRYFDTLESSVTVKEGYIKEYYCYTVEEAE